MKSLWVPNDQGLRLYTCASLSDQMIDIKICCGKHCSTLGGMNLLSILEEDPFLKKYCSINAVNCMDQCCDGEKSPTIMINGKLLVKATPELIQEEVRRIIDSLPKSK